MSLIFRTHYSNIIYQRCPESTNYRETFVLATLPFHLLPDRYNECINCTFLITISVCTFVHKRKIGILFYSLVRLSYIWLGVHKSRACVSMVQGQEDIDDEDENYIVIVSVTTMPFIGSND